MAVDIRQVVAAFLTFSMFVMLGNMIKRDHFDFEELTIPATSSVQLGSVKVSKRNVVGPGTTGPWMEDEEPLQVCWNQLATKIGEHSKGYIVFSLTNGPEYHASQIADAVVVAKYLKATLVLPDIRGSRPGEKRNFGEIYDAEEFIKSLNGVINVVKKEPDELSTGKSVGVVKIPNRVSEDYIATHVQPLFTTKKNLRLVTYFPSISMRKAEESEYLDTYACLGMFGTLQLQPEVEEMVDSMIGRLKTLSRKSNGMFIAVDLKVEMSKLKGCQRSGITGEKSCYDAKEVGEFLQKIGFDRETTVYVTQSGWHNSLGALREIFPKTYTKEGIMPVDKRMRFLGAHSPDFDKLIDFYICSESDIFVPGITSGLFYANVAGRRIASGKTQILVPGKITSSASVTDFISLYVSKKNHFAYTCTC